MQPIIDTHIHIWNFAKAEYQWLNGNTSILNRTYNIAELEIPRGECGITEGILVQASNSEEDTKWMLEVAADNDWIKGVVGWLPLMDPIATQKIMEAQYLKNKYFKGVRHLIHDEKNPEWLLQPSVLDSLKLLAKKNIPFDVVGILPDHIETVMKVAEIIPDLKMVFDHLNQPPIATKETFGRWGKLMQAAASYPNIYAKISGLGTASGNFESWTSSDIIPYIAFVLEQFGTGRCFCGGDWPVSLLAGTYTKTWNSYKTIIDQLLDATDSNKIFYRNAHEFYNL